MLKKKKNGVKINVHTVEKTSSNVKEFLFFFLIAQ